MRRYGYVVGRSLALCSAAVFFVATGCSERAPESPALSEEPVSQDIILATTTSTQDSGLLDVLVPMFEANASYRVKTIAVGTGEALKMGERGDADVLLVHAPSREKKSIEAGHTIDRVLVMHNDFLIVGPEDDPAGVAGTNDAAAAVTQIAASAAGFVSRGDNSGTHFREQGLWEKAEIEPAGEWYLESGQGMGATLMVASEKGAYTLTDRATYLALKANSLLVPRVEGDPMLLNIYSVMEVNPETHEGINNAGAQAFSYFLVAPETQDVIRTFGIDKFGEPLFFPDAGRLEEEVGQ